MGGGATETGRTSRTGHRIGDGTGGCGVDRGQVGESMGIDGSTRRQHTAHDPAIGGTTGRQRGNEVQPSRQGVGQRGGRDGGRPGDGGGQGVADLVTTLHGRAAGRVGALGHGHHRLHHRGGHGAATGLGIRAFGRATGIASAPRCGGIDDLRQRGRQNRNGQGDGRCLRPRRHCDGAGAGHHVAGCRAGPSGTACRNKAQPCRQAVADGDHAGRGQGACVADLQGVRGSATDHQRVGRGGLADGQLRGANLVGHGRRNGAVALLVRGGATPARWRREIGGVGHRGLCKRIARHCQQGKKGEHHPGPASTQQMTIHVHSRPLHANSVDSHGFPRVLWDARKRDLGLKNQAARAGVLAHNRLCKAKRVIK